MSDKIILKASKCENKTGKVPIWFMRQAGRYLPEYIKIKDKYKNFLSMCNDPCVASQITLLPVKRFNLDAAIIFSDILTIPSAMGAEVNFIKDHGPIINYGGDLRYFIDKNKDIDINSSINPLFESIKIVHQEIEKNKTIIGFAGGPFTLCCYLLEGGKSYDFTIIKMLANKNRSLFHELLSLFTKNVIKSLIGQIESGADVVKIFDSHCSFLNERDFNDFVIEPSKIIIDAIKEKYDVPIMGFPRGAGVKYLDFINKTGFDCVTFDYTVPVNWIKNNSGKRCIQGNLDPMVLATDLKEAEQQTKHIISELCSDGFIFNLGHGVLPFTPVENVARIIDIVKNHIYNA